jgi:asparagine synthase (glutamine-hydrolysing)
MIGVFLFLVRPSGDPITAEIRERFNASAAQNELPHLGWTGEENTAAAVGPDVDGSSTGPMLVRSRRLLVVGNARLDNPKEVAGWTNASERLSGAKDLEIIARAIEHRGPSCISRILGDFAFLAWDGSTQRLTAARDAFGVKGLYYAETPDLLAFASRAALLADGEQYDREFMLEYLSGSPSASGRTVFSNVSSLPPGTMLKWHRGRSELSRYWSPEASARAAASTPDHVEAFRDLFVRGLMLRLTGRADVWAQLSGGLDSSSIVSTAQWLARTGRVLHGVSGTVTVVDTLGSGDETEFVGSVLNRYNLQNDRVVDVGMWEDCRMAPPLTDQPFPAYPFFSRDRRMADAVGAGGGRVLLSGEGADHYLTGNLYFLADWISDGDTLRALRSLSAWAGLLKTSLWRLGFKYALVPLLPTAGQRLLIPAHRLPPWLRADRSVRAWLADPSRRKVRSSGQTCSRYAEAIAHSISTLQPHIDNEIVGSHVEMRFPFLYRPLVEWSLGLAPEMRSRARERKWILRQAMRGIVPELVRNRSSKGSITGRFVWSITHEAERLNAMLQNPILGQLGIVDTDRLRTSVTAIREGGSGADAPMAAVLSLETWLQVRSGRWRSQGQEKQHPVGNPAHNHVVSHF